MTEGVAGLPTPASPATFAEREAFAEVTGVYKRFRRKRGEPLSTLEDVSFRVYPGELVSLLGPSGCGKTTMLRIIAGLDRPSSGSVTVRGRTVTEPQPDFGMVFQAPVLLPWRTALGNVLLTMEVLKRNDRRAAERAGELLATVGLAGFEGHRPAQLSGGMQQRVALCRALIHEPELLLMDEPFGALDELTRMGMNDLLLELRQRLGTTVVFVTHSISEAVYLSDRVLVLSARPGRVAASVEVGLPYPRHPRLRHTPEFNELELRMEAALGLERG